MADDVAAAMEAVHNAKPAKAPAKAAPRKRAPRKAPAKVKALTKNRLGLVVTDNMVANYNEQAASAEKAGNADVAAYWRELTNTVK